jgi:DNA-binding NarL/FixJ family response regulator
LAFINGYSVPDIAQMMHILPRTLSTYKRRIGSKLSINSDRELFDKAIKENIINFSPKVTNTLF